MTEAQRILMVGPDDTVLGGMTSVQQIYRQYWDYEAQPLRYVGIYSAGSKFRKLLVALRGLLMFTAYLVFWRPDIVHVHFSWKAGFYRESIFMLLAKLSGIVTIAHAHAPDFDSFYREQASFAKRYIRFVFRQLDQLIVLSQIWQNYYKNFAPESRIIILYNPAEVPDLPATTKEKSLILFLGELGKRKGIYDLLKAIPSVIETYPQVEFYLCGNGDIAKVRQLIESNQLTEHVQLQGWVRGQKKHQLLSDARILVLPSHSEGLPMSVIESMMYRVPVITTPVGSIPDLFTDKEHVLLVEPGNVAQLSTAIESLLSNEDSGKQMAENAFELATNRFTCDEILSQLYGHYRRLKL